MSDHETTSWLARFEDPAVIRRLGVIEYVACKAKDGSPRVLVARSADAPADAAGELLAEIARVHRLIDHPRVPKVAEVDDGAPLAWIALASGGVVDFESLAQAVVESGFAIDHGGAVSFTVELLEVLQAVHQVTDPETARPVSMGAFATVNVLADESGAIAYLGWGHPWRGPARTALLAQVPVSFLAPEAPFGVAPSPGSDLAAATRFLHSFERLGEVPAAVTACLAGDTSAPALGELVVALLQNSQAPRPADRSIPRFVEDFAKTVAILGLRPDPVRFAADIRAVLAKSRAAARRRPLVVARDGRWCKPPRGDLIQLDRRGAMRRMVAALATARRDAPGEPLSWEDLLRAGWPEENPKVEAAKNRVYVTVAQLRALGLRDVLTRTDAGYLFDPAVPIAWSDAPPEG